MFGTSIGGMLTMGIGREKTSRLSRRDNVKLMGLSVLFTLNIAASNVSLSMVSVPLHQVLRSTCPVVTIGIYHALGRTYSGATYVCMIPLILGVALATAGDYHCTTLGLEVATVGVVLSSVKAVVTNRLMTGSMGLSTLELLVRMSPLAATQCVLYAALTGEVTHFRTAYLEGRISILVGVGLVSNAAIAFALNLVSLQTNKVASALTVAVCGNVKQALTIGLGIFFFHVEVSWLNAIGMALTLAGAASYSKTELANKRA